MSTFLFLWNPLKWPWADREERLVELAANGQLVLPWSCVARRQLHLDIDLGNEVRAILLRSGGPRESQGIIGWGQINELPFEGPHFDEIRARAGDTLWYANIQFDELFLDVPVGLNRAAVLEELAPGSFVTLPMSSGRRMDDADAEAIWEAIEDL